MFPTITINGTKVIGYDDLKKEFLVIINKTYQWIAEKEFFKMYPNMEFSIPIRGAGYEQNERKIIRK